MEDQAPNFYQLTRQIATQLGETERTPLGQIRRMLHTIGPSHRASRRYFAAGRSHLGVDPSA